MDAPFPSPLIQPSSRNDFHIAIICALPLEANAITALFDRFYEDQGPIYGKDPRDKNSYTTGTIGHHNVVLAHMPSMGQVPAAVVARGLPFSFPEVKLALVVGICGGVPRGTDVVKEVLLGDVIISNGAVQYDFGKQFPHVFSRSNTLNDSLSRQSTEIRSFLGKLANFHTRSLVRKRTYKYLAKLCVEHGVDGAHYTSAEAYMQYEPSYRYPGADEDHLFEPSYRHMHHTPTACKTCLKCKTKDDHICDAARHLACSDLNCDRSRLVRRERVENAWNMVPWAPKPAIHLGVIATGNTVMKSGEHRDEIAAREKVIAFEMEAAGVWEEIDCVIIKGVYDYADSHKNDKWRAHAAATAAACTKALLEVWTPSNDVSQSMPQPSSGQPSGSILQRTSPAQLTAADPIFLSSFPSHSRNSSQSSQLSGDRTPLRNDFWLSIENGNQSLVEEDPQTASEHFHQARTIWESTQSGSATAYIQVQNCLTACAIQMTYYKTEPEKKNKYLNKADEYTQMAYCKIFESTDPQDIPRVQLNQIIVNVRREQLGSKNGKLHLDRASRLLKQLQSVTKDAKWLCEHGYDASDLISKVDGWIKEIGGAESSSVYKLE